MPTKKKPLPDVKPGQVWVDTDRRNQGEREVKVLSINKNERSKKDPIWICAVFRNGKDMGRTTKVRQSRFKPGSAGYRLKDEPLTEPTPQADPFKEVDAKSAVVIEVKTPSVSTS